MDGQRVRADAALPSEFVRLGSGGAVAVSPSGLAGLPSECAADLRLWRSLLDRDSEVLFLQPPAMDFEAVVITDACAGSGAAEGCAWDSGCGVGGVGPNQERFAAEATEELFPWLAARREGANLAGAMELLASLVALKLWAPSLRSEARETIVGFPMASGNLANVYITGRMYTSALPLANLLRELAATSTSERIVPAALHVPGPAIVVPDRLPRGFVSVASIRALGLDPARRRSVLWETKNSWVTDFI